MKPAVKKAIWCVVILLVIAALTYTGVKKVNKSKKHDEKFQNNVCVSNKAMTFQIRPIKKYGAFDKLHRGALHNTQIVTNNNKTRTPLLVPRYKPCDESINEYVQSCSKPFDASNIRPRHVLRNNLHNKLQKQRFKSYEVKQTEDLGHSSSDVDESFKLLYISHKQSTSDCFACKPDKALVEVPVDDYERLQKDEHNITSRSGSSTKYSILDVGNNSIPNQNHNENTDYKPKQELTDLSVNEPRVGNFTVSCECKVPCDNTCNLDNQNYTINEAEKQFFISLSKFIVNEINIYEGEEKIPRGKLYKFKGYGLTVVHVNSPSYVFKTNYNDKDLVVKYIEDISLAPNEAEITINAKHENIVEVYYSFYTEDKKGFFIVMEAMDCNLCQYSKQHPDKLKDVIKSVVNALQYLHSKGIAHCDLKLGNILVKTVEGKTVCKLCDFGGALYIDGDEVIKPKRFSITDEYVAPETYFSSTFSKKTDIWLLGHTIWFYTQTECIFDTIPGLCDPDKYKEYLESPEDCPLRKNRLDIINKCCTEDPEDRASFETILQWCNESD